MVNKKALVVIAIVAIALLVFLWPKECTRTNMLGEIMKECTCLGLKMDRFIIDATVKDCIGIPIAIDMSCQVDSDCKLSTTECGCYCGCAPEKLFAVNKNWTPCSPWTRFPACETCRPCPGPLVTAKCIDNICMKVPVNSS